MTSQNTMLIPYNTSNKTWTYNSETKTVIQSEAEKMNATLAEEFTIRFLRKEGRNTIYARTVNNRFFLNERNFPIKEKDLNTVRRLALLTASLNDTLELIVAENFSMIGLHNVEEIQEKWVELRGAVIEQYPDLVDIVKDFDWQMQHDNMQQAYINNTSLNNFFCGHLNKSYEAAKTYANSRVVGSALDQIDIPIDDRITVYAKDPKVTPIVSIETEAKEIDTKHEMFNYPRLQQFCTLHAEIAQKDIARIGVDNRQTAQYLYNNEHGCIEKITCQSRFEVIDLYKKEITYNCKIKNYG